MEKFVDRIIETDRKAREIIENAQLEKDKLQKEGVERAKEALTQRASQQQAQMAVQDKDFAARAEAEADVADEEYIAAKHQLDKRFDAGHDAWVSEIVSACTTAN